MTTNQQTPPDAAASLAAASLAGPAPEPSERVVAAQREARRSARRLIGIVGVMITAAAVGAFALVQLDRADDTDSGAQQAVVGQAARPTPLDRNQTCALETTYVANLLNLGDAAVQQTMSVIGYQSMQFRLAGPLQATINVHVYRVGVGEAMPIIEAEARRLCAEYNDPLLSWQQVEGLKPRLLTGASTLSRVEQYGEPGAVY